MKINISIDASPEEMREFFGLPNIRPLQEEMMEAIRKNMQQGTTGFDPLNIMKPLLPAQMQTMEMMQKAFLDTFNHDTASTPKDGKKPDKTTAKTGRA